MAEYQRVLRGIGIFQELTAEDIDQVAGLIKERRLSKGATLFRQGDPGDALFVVQSGKVEIQVRSTEDGIDKTIAFFGPGGAFGEMALLTGAPRSATALVVEDATLLFISKEDFEAYLATSPVVMRRMMQVMAQRQNEVNVRLAGSGVPEGKKAPGVILVIYGPKGGSGRTTVATGLAMALGRDHPNQVALVDLAVTFSHDALLLNVVPRGGLAETTADLWLNDDPESRTENLNYYLSQHPSGVRVLSGSLKPEDAERLTVDVVRACLASLKSEFAWVIVDTAADFRETTLAALENADQIWLLASPDITALKDVKECERIFKELMHLDEGKLRLVINNIYAFKPPLASSQFAGTAGLPLYAELPYGGDVPATAGVKGEPFLTLKPDNVLSKALISLAKRLREELTSSQPELVAAGDDKERKHKGLFGR
jgi:CRP-like cAMP-binding protein